LKSEQRSNQQQSVQGHAVGFKKQGATYCWSTSLADEIFTWENRAVVARS